MYIKPHCGRTKWCVKRLFLPVRRLDFSCDIKCVYISIQKNLRILHNFETFINPLNFTIHLPPLFSSVWWSTENSIYKNRKWCRHEKNCNKMNSRNNKSIGEMRSGRFRWVKEWGHWVNSTKISPHYICPLHRLTN